MFVIDKDNITFNKVKRLDVKRLDNNEKVIFAHSWFVLEERLSSLLFNKKEKKFHHQNSGIARKFLDNEHYFGI